MAKAKSGGMGLIGGIILVVIIWVCGSYWGHRSDRDHPKPTPGHSKKSDHPMQDDLPKVSKSKR